MASDHRRILAKNLATTIILALASYELINPMRALQIDLADVMEKMYQHYGEVTKDLGLRLFPEQAAIDVVLELVRKRTPHVIRAIQDCTDENGEPQVDKILKQCARAVVSPRALRDFLRAA